MADMWSEIGKGSNVWIIARELYSSAAVCVSNRSNSMREVVVDASRCGNALVLAADTDRISPTSSVVKRLVPAGETVVVFCLSPLVPGEGLIVNLDANCSEGPPPSLLVGDDDDLYAAVNNDSNSKSSSASPARGDGVFSSSGGGGGGGARSVSTSAAFLSEAEQQSRQVDDWLEKRKKMDGAA